MSGISSKLGDDDQFLEFETQRDDLFAEGCQVVLVAVARFFDNAVGAKTA